MPTGGTKASGGRAGKPTGTEQVAAFLEALEHPLKKEIAEVRRIVLGADGRLTEHIKWNAPSFCRDGEDRLTFNLQGNGFFRLVFHCGAKKLEAGRGKGRLIEDASGLLEWAADDRAIVKFANMDEVENKRERLAEVVSKWLEAAKS